MSYRTRMRVNVKREEGNQEGKVVESALSLNEMIMEEAFGAKTCTYQLGVDGESFGVLRSSGLIVSTGSGATGLLLSARRPRISEL